MSLKIDVGSSPCGADSIGVDDEIDPRRILAIIALPIVLMWTYGAGYLHSAMTHAQTSQKVSNLFEQTDNTASKLYITNKICDKASGKSNLELCASLLSAFASKSSAESAKQSVYVSLIGTIISAGGAFLLLMTIFQGRTALSRASQANAITDFNGRAQIRAYCSIEEVKLSPGGTSFNGYIPHRLFFDLKNSGSSPAFDVSVLLIPKMEDLEGFNVTIHKGDLYSQYSGGHEVMYSLPPQASTISNPPNKIPSAMAEIVLSYSDVFGDRHEKRYVFECPYFFADGQMRMWNSNQKLHVT